MAGVEDLVFMFEPSAREAKPLCETKRWEFRWKKPRFPKTCFDCSSRFQTYRIISIGSKNRSVLLILGFKASCCFQLATLNCARAHCSRHGQAVTHQGKILHGSGACRFLRRNWLAPWHKLEIQTFIVPWSGWVGNAKTSPWKPWKWPVWPWKPRMAQNLSFHGRSGPGPKKGDQMHL